MGRDYRSWGRLDFGRQSAAVLTDRFEADLGAATASLLPFGNGRSYGDSCQNTGNRLLDVRGLDRFISADWLGGVLRCEAGLLLGEILNLTLPHGWFLPVLPGTQLVTVGGAIANDVHGKNHHAAGTFGCHVRRFELLRSDGSRLVCSPTSNPELFAATIGGLGLTGVVVWAELQLRRVASSSIDAETIKFGSLRDFFALDLESRDGYEYRVAWIDCFSAGRGLYTRGNHAGPADDRSSRPRQLRVPLTPPISLVGKSSLRLFNRAYYASQRKERVVRRVPFQPFFFPLDAIAEWNRIYGPAGFFQHQSVIPHAGAEAGVAAMLQEIGAAGEGSFLAVLKTFGERRSPGMLSFPRPGVTLALDFPNRGTTTRALLERLDDIVAGEGGAVYPAKDARMSASFFQRSFERLGAFRRHVDPRFSSSFWRRVTASDRTTS